MRFHSVLGHCMCSLLDDVSVLTGQMGLEYLRNVKRKAALKIIRSKPKLWVSASMDPWLVKELAKIIVLSDSNLNKWFLGIIYLLIPIIQLCLWATTPKVTSYEHRHSMKHCVLCVASVWSGMQWPGLFLVLPLVCFPGPPWQRLFKTTSGLWTGVTEFSSRTSEWHQLCSLYSDLFILVMMFHLLIHLKAVM